MRKCQFETIVSDQCNELCGGKYSASAAECPLALSLALGADVFINHRRVCVRLAPG